MVNTYRKFDQYRSDNRFAVIFDDFGDLVASAWQATGTGSPAMALDADYSGGAITLATSAGGTATTSAQKGDGGGSTGKATPFIPARGKKFSFVTRVEIVSPDPFTGSMGAGVYPSNANPLGETGVGLAIDEAGEVTAYAFSNSVKVDYVLGRAAETVAEIEVYYDGGEAVMFFLNGERIAKVALPTNVPTTALSPTVGIGNEGTAAAHTVAVDYIGLAIER